LNAASGGEFNPKRLKQGESSSSSFLYLSKIKLPGSALHTNDLNAAIVKMLQNTHQGRLVPELAGKNREGLVVLLNDLNLQPLKEIGPFRAQPAGYPYSIISWMDSLRFPLIFVGHGFFSRII